MRVNQPFMILTPSVTDRCKVRWVGAKCTLGSRHGCYRWHGHLGPHICYCAFDKPEEGVTNAGTHPYYGLDTHFYGEDTENEPSVL